MTSRSKKLVELALQQQANESKQDDSLFRQLEDPNFISTLPVLILDESLFSTQSNENFSEANIDDIILEQMEEDNNVLVNDCTPSEAAACVPLPDTATSSSFIAVPFKNIASSPLKESDIANRQDSSVYSDESNQEFPLVPYSEHSDSDISVCEEKRTAKRRKRCQVDKSTWLCEKNKIKREKGLTYFGRKKHEAGWENKVPKQPRALKERCKCTAKEKTVIKCFCFSEDDRKAIFETFWKMTWGQKKVYIDGLVQTSSTKRPRDRKNAAVSRRTLTLIYHLRKGDMLIRVCKVMFLNTLCIGKWCVLKWKKSMGCNSASTEENESLEAAKPRVLKPFAKERESMNNFLESLPKLESHYCRKTTDKKYLLPEWRSKRELYNFYVSSWCEEHNVKPLSVCSFNNALEVQKISLFQPKKDQCQICNSHKLGHYSDEKHALHIEMKEDARREKQGDKEGRDYVFTMDLQAVLLSPKSKVSSLYYKTKLCVHNFCLFDIKTKDGFCYLWNESEGGLNAEEFATIVTKFLSDTIIPRLLTEEGNDFKIILYSDGCTYQNRNATMTNALLNLAMSKSVIIEQKFLEVGHTQMEADSMHAMIEKQLKNKNINIPAEYIEICRKARRNPKPYNISYLTHTMFKKFDQVEFFKSIRPGKKKGDPKV